MFLTQNDFTILPYSLPQSVDAPNSLNDYIVVAEKEVLQSILGYELYTEFVSALFVDPTATPLVPIPEIDIAQKWKDLRDGATYQLQTGGKVYRYTGVKALLKPYITSRWIGITAKQLTSVGVTVSKTENSVLVDPTDLISDRYAEYSRLIGGSGVDPYWSGGHYGCGSGLYNTFFGYMITKWEEDYLSWEFVQPDYENEFDL